MVEDNRVDRRIHCIRLGVLQAAAEEAGVTSHGHVEVHGPPPCGLPRNQPDPQQRLPAGVGKGRELPAVDGVAIEV